MSEKIILTWEDIKQDCKTLADSLLKENITCIIGIANGGMIPATLLAKHLKVDKLLSANLKSYVDDKPRDGVHSETDIVKLITFPDFGTLKDEEKILIVDDLADTGMTLRKVKQIDNIVTWERPEQNQWVYSTLYYKPKSTFTPHYTVRDFNNDEWIVFPWEN
tara:strand:- start:11 stop:499 length:489 start_codon:yes stop_codon:yes gene_type:complete